MNMAYAGTQVTYGRGRGLVGWRVPAQLGGGVVALQLVAIYSPRNGFLDLVALSAVEFGICIGVGVALLVVIETEKWRRRSKSKAAALPASGVGRRI